MATDTTAEGKVPAQIAAAPEGIHRATLVQNFLRQVSERAAKPALFFRTGDRYAAIPWNEFGKAARRWAGYLLSEGVAAHEHVGIWSANRPEWHIADMGVLMVRARPVPVYFTFSAEQGGYVLGHSESKVVVVENGALRDRVLEVRGQLPALRRLVVLDGQDHESGDGFVVPWQFALTRGEAALAARGSEIDRRSESVSLD